MHSCFPKFRLLFLNFTAANDVAGRSSFHSCLSISQSFGPYHYPLCIGTQGTGTQGPPLDIRPHCRRFASPQPPLDMRSHCTGTPPVPAQPPTPDMGPQCRGPPGPSPLNIGPHWIETQPCPLDMEPLLLVTSGGQDYLQSCSNLFT